MSSCVKCICQPDRYKYEFQLTLRHVYVSIVCLWKHVLPLHLYVPGRFMSQVGSACTNYVSGRLDTWTNTKVPQHTKGHECVKQLCPLFIFTVLEHSSLELASCAEPPSIAMLKRPASAMVKRPAAAVVSDHVVVADVSRPKKRRTLKAVNTDASVASEDYVCVVGRAKRSEAAYVECTECGLQASVESISDWFGAGACPSCNSKKVIAIDELPVHL